MVDRQIEYKLTLDDTNVVKCIAVCAMVVYHLFGELHPGFGSGLRNFSIVCKSCVSMFLFVSGYGLTVQYSKLMSEVASETRTVKAFATLKFMLKRFVKFYLNYWAVFLIAVPVGVFVFGRSMEIAYGAGSNVLGNLFLDFFAVNGYESYNVTWWFNRLIIVAYILFPLLYVAFRSKYVGLAVFALVFVWPHNVLFVLDKLTPDAQDVLFAFVFGMFCAKYSGAINRLLNKFNPYFVLLGFVFLTIGFCILNIQPYIPFFYGIDTNPYIAVFVAYSVVCIRRLFSLKSRGALFVGKHATNIYLLHTFILGYFFHDFIYGINQPLLMFLAVMGITLGFSVVFEFAKSKLGFYKLQDAITRRISPRPQE